MPKFDVTFEIVTPESAEDGDAEERGYVSRSVTLRQAVGDLHSTRTSAVDGVQSIEANESPVRSPRWITVFNGPEFETGANESRSLHIPPGVTDSSRLRIARLAGLSI